MGQRGSMKFPDASDSGRVGSYPAHTKSGAGLFWDEVLEYRVWVHPERGGPDPFEREDYFRAFASYEAAADFSEKAPGAEIPLVLVRQDEHINEPEPGVFEHVVGERITEWRVEWLEGSKREPTSIARFLEESRRDA